MANLLEKELYLDFIEIFKTIKTANQYAPGKNYETNFGDLLVDWSLFPVDDGESEYVTLEDPEINYAEQEEESADHKVSYTYVLKGFIAKGDNTVEQIRAFSRDVRRCIGANLATLKAKFNSPPIVIKPVILVKGFQKGERTRGGLVFRFTAEWSQEKWLIDEPEY